MIVYRILAVTWFGMWCFVLFNLLRRKFRISPPKYLKSKDSIDAFWVGAWAFGALGLIGIAASVLLFIGVTWALWFIGLCAIGCLIGVASTIVFGRRFGIRLNVRDWFILSISLITLVIVIGWDTNIFHF